MSVAEETLEEASSQPKVLEYLYRFVPAFDSLRTYSLRTFRADVISGLTVASVAVPQAMAYALIAGIPPQYGLYTAIVMTAVGALLDSSKQLINGPTNAISIALLSAVGSIATADEKIQTAVLLGLLVGVVQTGITLLRLGDLTRYISQGVIVGFTVGASVLLVLDQLKNLLGLAGQGGAHDHFLQRFWLTVERGRIHPYTAVVGLGSIVLVYALRRLSAVLRWRLPELLLTVVFMAVVVWACNLQAQGVAVIRTIPQKLPWFQPPELDWGMMQKLSGSAMAIALLGLLEAIAMAKAISAQTGQKLDMNQQCLSEGMANISGSFFQCFPGSGSLTRSAINQQTGAMTQWSGVYSAAAVAATVLVFAPFAYYIPRAALAGLLMVTAYGMIDYKQLRFHLGATRFDAGIVIATALAAVVISVEFCILIGVILSFVLYIPRAAHVHLTELTVTPERIIRERVPGDPPCGRILIYNLEGELFFGSAPHLMEFFEEMDQRAQDGVRVVVLRLKRAHNPDAVCLELIDQLLTRLDARQITVLLCGVRRDLAKVLRHSGLKPRLNSRHVFLEEAGTWSSTLDAVRYAYELVGNDLCPICPRHGMPANVRESWYYMI